MIDKGSNILWIDFLANATRLADMAEQKKLVQLAKEAGITHLVIDAKIPYGQVTYLSRIAPHVSTWSDGRYHDWKDRDFLRELLNEAHEQNLKVIANMNVFAEGARSSRDGLAYERQDWQVLFVKPQAEGMPAAYVKAEEYGEGSLFVNPIHPQVRAHELSIIREIADSYDVDGIVLDRCRYPNVYGDFSALSKEKFEEYLNEAVAHWPEDIFTGGYDGDPIVHGKYFGKWTEWRAHNIKSFVQEARSVVKSINPSSLFCIYVGSWYPNYYQEGVNWGSTTYHAEADLDWASAEYRQAGYAEELDFLMTGCYYPNVYKQEALERGITDPMFSVEGGMEWSEKALDGAIPYFASLYLHEYAGNPKQFRKAVHLCRERSHGVMLFDVCHLEAYQWWNELSSALNDDSEVASSVKPDSYTTK